MLLYEQIASTPEGRRALAVSRLTCLLTEEMYTALDEVGTSLEEASRHLTRRQRRRLKNLEPTAGALATLLYACGFELATRLVPVGRPRAEVLARRAAVMRTQAFPAPGTEPEPRHPQQAPAVPDRRSATEAGLDEAVHLLRRLVEHEEDPCVLDHLGAFCLVHDIGNGEAGMCAVADARAFLNRQDTHTDDRQEHSPS